MRLKLLAFVLMSCSSPDMELPSGHQPVADDYDGMIVLGDRLENPYKTENITKALESLYPVKSGKVKVASTNLYVRFLPADGREFDILLDSGIDLIDHPLDYQILKEGDWYHDPEIDEGQMTWQYAVVPFDFVFPDVRYEIIDECFLSENMPQTRNDDGIDWNEVEKEAYRITGNGFMVNEGNTKGRGNSVPSGRITIVDEETGGGRPFGVAGVRVSCNSFVRFDHAYTDRDGYYTMNRSFSSDLRYRLVFKNERGFSLGFNLILVPASVSSLGKSGPDGMTANITAGVRDRLYRRCAVNNSAYDYYARCSSDDLDIVLPPSDLRIWIFDGLDASSAVMLHHGAVLDNDKIKGFLGGFASILKFLLPDITLGTRNIDDYKRLYSTVCHELAHASHFSVAGTDFWNKYIYYIISSYLRTGGMTYGDGESANAGYCAVGEMWAYYMESLMYKDRYGGGFPSFGTSYWFYPQILRMLDERGISCSRLFSVLNDEVNSHDRLKAALVSSFPLERMLIEQVFSRYNVTP